MKRIIKAINEGINRSILQFEDDGPVQFSKSKNVSNISNYLQDYKLGDYVYFDNKLGYNNSAGEKVAICVNNEPNNQLFGVLNHPLSKIRAVWANDKSNLYNDVVKSVKSGYENTQYILENYSDELEGTVWEQLKENEYIPSVPEIETIYKNCKNNEQIWTEFNFNLSRYYWTSTQFPLFIGGNYPYSVFCFHFGKGSVVAPSKKIGERSLVLMRLNKS